MAIHLGRALLHASCNQPGQSDLEIGLDAPCPKTRRHPRCPYSVLLLVGFTMPSLLPEPRCALTAPFHPYLKSRSSRGGILSVALSLGLPPPGVTRHHISMEPGLSSARSRNFKQQPSSRLV